MKNYWLDKIEKSQLWEFCFQFDGCDPEVVAEIQKDKSVTLELRASPQASIAFTDNAGKVFKLFMRPKQ